MRYLIKFSYDGTNFCGFQKQPNQRSIESCFGKALYEINNHTETQVISSGRTDKGVHAIMQTAHFDLNIDITLYKLKCALNSNLPEDIHVYSTEIVDNSFHARYDVKYKIYEYFINVGEYNPIKRNYVFQYNRKLDIEAMREGIVYLIGKHNFQNYVSRESKKDNYEREIYEANIELSNDILKITFKGNGFMKYQVRNMVGTLLKVGRGKIKPIEIKNILEDSNKINEVYTIKSQGLYLKSVNY